MNDAEMRDEVKVILGAARETLHSDDELVDRIVRAVRSAKQGPKRWNGLEEALFWVCFVAFFGAAASWFYWLADELNPMPHHLEWTGPLGLVLMLIAIAAVIKGDHLYN